MALEPVFLSPVSIRTVAPSLCALVRLKPGGVMAGPALGWALDLIDRLAPGTADVDPVSLSWLAWAQYDPPSSTGPLSQNITQTCAIRLQVDLAPLVQRFTRWAHDAQSPCLSKRMENSSVPLYSTFREALPPADPRWRTGDRQSLTTVMLSRLFSRNTSVPDRPRPSTLMLSRLAFASTSLPSPRPADPRWRTGDRQSLTTVMLSRLFSRNTSVPDRPLPATLMLSRRVFASTSLPSNREDSQAFSGLANRSEPGRMPPLDEVTSPSHAWAAVHRSSLQTVIRSVILEETIPSPLVPGPLGTSSSLLHRGVAQSIDRPATSGTGMTLAAPSSVGQASATHREERDPGPVARSAASVAGSPRLVVASLTRAASPPYSARSWMGVNSSRAEVPSPSLDSIFWRTRFSQGPGIRSTFDEPERAAAGMSRSLVGVEVQTRKLMAERGRVELDPGSLGRPQGAGAPAVRDFARVAAPQVGPVRTDQPVEMHRNTIGPPENRPVPPAWSGPSPADLQRITDQVVRSLDDRISAQRERFGRI